MIKNFLRASKNTNIVSFHCHSGECRPGGHLWHVGQFLQDYTEKYSRRPSTLIQINVQLSITRHYNVMVMSTDRSHLGHKDFWTTSQIQHLLFLQVRRDFWITPFVYSVKWIWSTWKEERIDQTYPYKGITITNISCDYILRYFRFTGARRRLTCSPTLLSQGNTHSHTQTGNYNISNRLGHLKYNLFGLFAGSDPWKHRVTYDDKLCACFSMSVFYKLSPENALSVPLLTVAMENVKTIVQRDWLSLYRVVATTRVTGFRLSPLCHRLADDNKWWKPSSENGTPMMNSI